MISVLHVLDELRSSGAEVGLQGAAPLWNQYGVKCDILTVGSERGPFASSLEAAGYELFHLPFGRHASFFLNYADLLRKNQYDVVHIQLERAFVYLAALARLQGTKVVRTVRSNFAFEGVLARRRAFQRRFARAIGVQFVAISRSVADNEMSRFRNPTRHIDNWIDEARFRPPSRYQRGAARSELGVPNGAFVIATVGNCSDIKNHQSLLLALSGLRDREWLWLHVGAEDESYSEQRLARDLDIADRCRFMGRQDPLIALHAADLYAMPSLWEGLGMATVEALSTGLPALLTEVAGNRDLAGLSDRLIWCEIDATSLRSGLARAFDDRPNGHTSAESEVQHRAVAERFSTEAGIAAYAELYRAL